MCQSCEALTINGLLCHETGCPEAWRDAAGCSWCGQKISRDELESLEVDNLANRHRQFCSQDCAEAYFC